MKLAGELLGAREGAPIQLGGLPFSWPSSVASSDGRRASELRRVRLEADLASLCCLRLWADLFSRAGSIAASQPASQRDGQTRARRYLLAGPARRRHLSELAAGGKQTEASPGQDDVAPFFWARRQPCARPAGRPAGSERKEEEEAHYSN